MTEEPREKRRAELADAVSKARAAEEAGENFYASFLYKESLRIARQIGDAAAIRECKEKLIETNKKSKAEFKEISSEASIPQAAIDRVVNTIVGGGDLMGSLERIGKSPNLFPRIADVMGIAERTMPLSATIGSNSIISDEGHSVRGGSNGKLGWLMRMYAVSQGIIAELYLGQIFERLAEHGLDAPVLHDYFVGTGVFSQDDVFIMKPGLEAFFAGDFSTALHVLTPRIESVFLRHSARKNLDIIALNREKEISTSTKTLSENQLDDEAWQAVWGLDLCWQMKFALFNPLGLRLRHKAAHGELDRDDCTFENAVLILYFHLAFAARCRPEPR